MPTKADFDELIKYTNVEWVDDYKNTNVRGYCFTASNGNQIFLPAAGYRGDKRRYDAGSEGYYWSSSVTIGGSYCLLFDSKKTNVIGYFHRHLGHSIRPVHP